MGHHCLCPTLDGAFQPTPDSFQQVSQQMCPAWHLCVPMPHDTGSPVPLYLAKGNEGCPGSCWRDGGLSSPDRQGWGWPVDGQAGWQHWRHSARISWEGDPGGMIYWDFIAVSGSTQLIFAHKISSHWFSEDPSSQGADHFHLPLPQAGFDGLSAPGIL